MSKLKSLTDWFRQLGHPGQIPSIPELPEIKPVSGETPIDVSRFLVQGIERPEGQDDWVDEVIEVIESLLNLSRELAHYPHELSSFNGAATTSEEKLTALSAEIDHQVAFLRSKIQEGEDSRPNENLLWTAFSEFGRIRDSLHRDLASGLHYKELLIARYQDLLSARTRILFDGAVSGVSPDAREVALRSSQQIHRLLLKSSFPIDRFDGEPQRQLLSFFHAVEHLLHGLTHYILSDEREDGAHLAMYVDLIDSVQRANILDLLHTSYAGFESRLFHVQSFLEIIADQVPEDVLEKYSHELIAPSITIPNPGQFEQQVEDVIAHLDCIPVPEEHEIAVQALVTRLMALSLPYSHLDSEKQTTELVESTIVELSDVIERLQRFISPSPAGTEG
jgi:hypothetical protein